MTEVRPRAADDGGSDDDPRHAAPRRPSRREFAALLAGGAASAIGGAALGACAPAVTAMPAAAGPSPSPDTTAASSAAAPLLAAHRADPTTEALFAAVDARYGGRLEADEKAHVRDAIGRTVRLAAALRGHTLANAVDPFSPFCHHAAATMPAAAATAGGKGA